MRNSAGPWGEQSPVWKRRGQCQSFSQCLALSVWWHSVISFVICRYYYKREILERVDGRRLVYKFGKNARGWRENENWICQHFEHKPKHTQNSHTWRTPGRKYFKDDFSLIFMYHTGKKKICFWWEEGTLQLIKKLFCYFEVCPIWGTNVHSFLWNTMLYVVMVWFCLDCEVLFHCRNNRVCSLVLLAKRKEKKKKKKNKQTSGH